MASGPSPRIVEFAKDQHELGVQRLSIRFAARQTSISGIAPEKLLGRRY